MMETKLFKFKLGNRMLKPLDDRLVSHAGTHKP